MTRPARVSSLWEPRQERAPVVITVGPSGILHYSNGIGPTWAGRVALFSFY